MNSVPSGTTAPLFKRTTSLVNVTMLVGASTVPPGTTAGVIEM